MPGPTIGKQFNALPEVLWDARITILKVGTEYKIQYQYERGDATVDRIIREHLAEVVKGLAR